MPRGRERGLAQEGWNFLWVTHFPMFDYDEDEGRFVASHHPFTSPKKEDVARMLNGIARKEGLDLSAKVITLDSFRKK